MEGGAKGPPVKIQRRPIIPPPNYAEMNLPAPKLPPNITAKNVPPTNARYSATVAKPPKKKIVIRTGPIWDRVLGKEVPEQDKVEAIDVLSKLAFFDSIHDFWPERGKKKSTEEDADEPEELNPQERIDKVHETLVKSIQTYVGVADTIETILGGTTGGTVNSTSGIEDKVLAYLKKSYKPFNEPEATITVNEILTNWKFGKTHKSWEDYQAAILQLPSTVEISLDGKFIKSLENNELGYLGFFILAFMNPNVNPGKTDVNLTFDMGPRDIGKIFERFTQVKNGIYPQNVADSATTSFSALLGRSVFFRANYQPSSSLVGPVTHVARSNAFTNNKYDIVFVDRGFGPKNRLGFSIEVRRKGKTVVDATIPFGRGKEQGPSVNYLMDLLSSGDPKGVKPKLDKVAEVSGLQVVDPDLLFDIKRLGDQEQMLVDTSYGVTGDRFAGVFRRLLRKPGIFHSSKGFRVWRGNVAGEEEAIKQARDFRKQQAIEKLKLVSGILTNVSGIREQLDQMKEQVDNGAQSGTVFSDPIPINGLLTPEYIYENYTKIASTFATYILRVRMNDISEQIGGLIAKVDGLKGAFPEIKNAACIIDPEQTNPIDAEACPPPQAVTNETIDQALDQLEGFIQSMTELEAMNVPFFVKAEDGGVTFASTPVYTQLFSEDGRLLKGVTSSLFNFSSGAFLHPETGLAPIVGRLLALSRSSQLDTISDQINKLLVRYFQARDEIKEAFFNAESKANIEALTDITSGIDVPRIMSIGAGDNAQGLLDVIQNVAAGSEVAYGVPPPPVQQGGADGVPGSPLQFRDLHDLFAEICLEAQHALIIEKDPVKALNDIQVKWELEVGQNRTYAMDYYGAEFEETGTTNLISFLLSFRTEQPALFPEDLARREEVAFNDLGAILLTKNPVEPFILQTLATVGTQILTEANKAASANADPDEDKIGNTYAAPVKWKNDLPNAIYVATNPSREALALVRGGGLDGEDATPSNGDGTSGGSSRRRLYAGLRKRGGAGSDSGV